MNNEGKTVEPTEVEIKRVRFIEVIKRTRFIEAIKRGNRRQRRYLDFLLRKKGRLAKFLTEGDPLAPTIKPHQKHLRSNPMNNANVAHGLMTQVDANTESFELYLDYYYPLGPMVGSARTIAEYELTVERFNEEVEKEKTRLRNRRPWWHILFPYRVRLEKIK